MANEGERAGADCWTRCASYARYERKYAIKVLGGKCQATVIFPNSATVIIPEHFQRDGLRAGVVARVRAGVKMNRLERNARATKGFLICACATGEQPQDGCSPGALISGRTAEGPTGAADRLFALAMRRWAQTSWSPGRAPPRAPIDQTASREAENAEKNAVMPFQDQAQGLDFMHEVAEENPRNGIAANATPRPHVPADDRAWKATHVAKSHCQ